jgi:hypothetical protein
VELVTCDVAAKELEFRRRTQLSNLLIYHF